MNTDYAGRTPGWLCVPLGYRPANGFSPWEGAAPNDFYLCPSVSIRGCIGLLRLRRLQAHQWPGLALIGGHTWSCRRDWPWSEIPLYPELDHLELRRKIQHRGSSGIDSPSPEDAVRS